MPEESIPFPVTSDHSTSAATKRYKYVRRLFKFEQMDFEFAFWQMLNLFISPQKVCKNFQYRKRMKFQFARDDPAFLVLFAASLCITSVGFAIVLRLGLLQFIHFLLYTVFVDCIGIGILVATIFWFISNRYFRQLDEDDVEWGYAFDLFFYNGLINHVWFLSRLLGNTFWLVAVLYYIYITFIGYSSITYLKRTHFIMIPLPLILIFYIITLVNGFNITHFLMMYYKHRVI
ncbi:hypothetical protein NQ317_009931 [Molorchus minor]|uniref:Uncharacterized protein n=1 Tax=Molorchus minor TaxID=1323400 RepID=A0ABQ9K9M9_9CUCU|nr:hypothetical protein NQ317_009931 [Molorchus minor]